MRKAAFRGMPWMFAAFTAIWSLQGTHQGDWRVEKTNTAAFQTESGR